MAAVQATTMLKMLSEEKNNTSEHQLLETPGRESAFVQLVVLLQAFGWSW